MSDQNFIQHLFFKNGKSFSHFPDKASAEKFVADLFNLLFTSYVGKYDTEEKLAEQYQTIKNSFPIYCLN